jgi:hypothetical protein
MLPIFLPGFNWAISKMSWRRILSDLCWSGIQLRNRLCTHFISPIQVCLNCLHFAKHIATRKGLKNPVSLRLIIHKRQKTISPLPPNPLTSQVNRNLFTLWPEWLIEWAKHLLWAPFSRLTLQVVRVYGGLFSNWMSHRNLTSLALGKLIWRGT